MKSCKTSLCALGIRDCNLEYKDSEQAQIMLTEYNICRQHYSVACSEQVIQSVHTHGRLIKPIILLDGRGSGLCVRCRQTWSCETIEMLVWLFLAAKIVFSNVMETD